VVCCFTLLGAMALFAQEPAAVPTANTKAEETGLPKFRHFSFGVRVRGFPQNSMDDQNYFQTVPGSTTFTYNFVTTSTQPRVGLGPSFELSLTRRISIGVELLYNTVKYNKTTKVYTGAFTSTTVPSDARFITFTEDTKATYLDAPVMLRCRCVPVKHGLFSKLYLLGGAEIRNTGFISTTNSVTNTDGSSASNRVPTRPAKRNLFGKTAGLGFKFIDDVGIKVMPEVRYTQWSGRSFDSDSTRSSKKQLEVSIAIIY